MRLRRAARIYFCSGDLLRDNVKNRTPLGIKAESTIKSGSLVPDAMILRLILHELKTRALYPRLLFDYDTDSYVEQPSLAEASTPPQTSEDPSASFILDGFPRTVEQASQLDSLIPINLVVSLKTPASVILERIAGRWVHAPSGRVYNTTFHAPKDDCEETWKNGSRNSRRQASPLLEHYARKGVLWEVQGNSSDEISPKLYQEFERRFCRYMINATMVLDIIGRIAEDVSYLQGFGKSGQGTSSLQFINWHTLGKRLLAGCLLRALRRLIGIHFIFYYGTSFFAAFGIKQSFVAASGGFCWRYAVLCGF
ncbi:hypothetical protein EYC84_004495 [Monilinia fructicola]|uniref:Adenylate kinase active site lid domain-containing protein n=1 Tax=Monilinia fructicola TaxID=38448 RepID=A0A5M9K1C2_MONFR|nr:hypothetical protein EYC84_004495 [Monilinia fructicola]